MIWYVLGLFGTNFVTAFVFIRINKRNSDRCRNQKIQER